MILQVRYAFHSAAYCIWHSVPPNHLEVQHTMSGILSEVCAYVRLFSFFNYDFKSLGIFIIIIIIFVVIVVVVFNIAIIIIAIVIMIIIIIIIIIIIVVMITIIVVMITIIVIIYCIIIIISFDLPILSLLSFYLICFRLFIFIHYLL